MNDVGIFKSLENRRNNAAIEHLLGLINGVLADGQVNAIEIHFLSTWLAANSDIANTWPANAIRMHVQHAMQENPEDHATQLALTQVFQALIANDFAETGAVGVEPTQLPVQDGVQVIFENAGFCLTGEFTYGTRAECMKLVERMGGVVVLNPSKKMRYLVIGSRASESWKHASFGAKIARAVELQQQGYPVFIITEDHWLQSIRDQVRPD